MPGKMGDMKQVVRMPASCSSAMAAKRRSMLAALSMSARKPSSKVFMLNPHAHVGQLFAAGRGRAAPGRSSFGRTPPRRCPPAAPRAHGCASRRPPRACRGRTPNPETPACRDIFPPLASGFHVFAVHELPPRLVMARKALHEACVAVAACVGATHIGVRRIVAHRQVRLRQNGLRLYLAHVHETRLLSMEKTRRRAAGSAFWPAALQGAHAPP